VLQWKVIVEVETESRKMKEILCKVVFEPQGRTVQVRPGTLLLEAAARAGLMIETPCGGSGTCGKCRVRVMSGAEDPAEADRRHLSSSDRKAGWRLACQNRVHRDMVVMVPEGSLFAGGARILAVGTADAAHPVSPGIRKVFVEMSTPTLTDDQPDLVRLEKAIGPFRADLALIRALPGRLRREGFRGTAVLADHRLIEFEPGDTRRACYGVAVDVGTTTVVAELLDLCEGRSRGVVSRMNPQVAFGDDVLSRIRHGGTPEGLEAMRTALQHELGNMIETLCRDAGVAREQVYEAAFAGNTAMEQILLGVDPAPLGQLPFVPGIGPGLLIPALELGVPIHPRGMAYLFPVIGGFVGGDTVAGLLAARLEEQEAPALLVDIGTNGEIVLWDGAKFQAASTAAGPAFEGARISCGMRGTRGAIEKVEMNADVHLEVIGNTEPMGLCGSGLIDAIAELLNHGLLTPEGQLRAPAECPPRTPEALCRRLRENDRGERLFVLAERSDVSRGDPLALTQRDIREVQLGAGAIRAGIAILLRQAGLAPADLKTVLVAGGFGNFVRRSSAQRIGLLPAGIDHRRIRYIGNASLAGARLVLLSTEARKEAEVRARKVHHLDLSLVPEFQEAFAEAMLFPD